MITARHKASAKVGKDTIDDVEYLVFDDCNWWKERELKTFKDKLENLLDNVTTPFWKTRRWIKDTYWEVRYGFQRMFKGYDSVDTFETFAKFIERYTKILTEYRKKHVGYVATMTNEEWEDVVDDMLYHLHYMDERNVEEELEKDVPDGWHASQITIDNIMLKHKDEFFKLFSEYFYNLWD